MNDRLFINNSAIGLYPLMVVDRDTAAEAARPKQAAGDARRLGPNLARFNHQRLTLTVNDEKARVDTPLLFVGNNDYRLDIGAAGQREKLDDGQLFVLVMRKKTRLGLIAASIRALFDRARSDDMVTLDGVQRLRVDSRKLAACGFARRRGGSRVAAARLPNPQAGAEGHCAGVTEPVWPIMVRIPSARGCCSGDTGL